MARLQLKQLFPALPSDYPFPPSCWQDLHIIDELLQQCAPMAALARGVRVGLARSARLKAAADGEVVCRAGEPMDKILVVISGEVRGRQKGCSGGYSRGKIMCRL